MDEKTDVWQGTLALMVLRTLETLGPLHGYGLARRIEQTSADQSSLARSRPVSCKVCSTSPHYLTCVLLSQLSMV